MKCPTCNAWSNVLETRTKEQRVRRRRQCANLHVFYTEEVEVPAHNHGGMRPGGFGRKPQQTETTE